MNNNKKGMIFILLLIVLKFVIVPWFQNILEKSESLNQKIDSLSKYQRMDEQQTNIEKEIIKYKEFIYQYEERSFIGSRAKVTSQTFDHLKTIAENTGSEIKNLRIGELQQADISFYPIEFTIDGNAQSVADFITYSESGSYLLVTTKATMRSNRGDKGLTVFITMYAVITDNVNE